MQNELLQGLSNLRDAASGLSAQLAWAVAGSQTMADSSGTVSITLTADNAVTGFSLRSGWRQQLSKEEFGAAIVQAFNNAAKAATEGFASRAKQVANGDNLPQSERRLTPTSDLPTPSPEEAAAFARTLRQALIEADERVSEFKDLVTRQQKQPRSVASRSGMVQLMVGSNMLARVDINERWLKETPDATVETELRDVLKSAFLGISRHARQTATAIPAIANVFGAASHPADLLRQLGLTSPQEARDDAADR